MRKGGADRFEQHYDRKQEENKRFKAALPNEDEGPLPPPVDPIKSEAEPRRNDPCPCGSGKKYKQCCLKKA